MVEGSRVGVSGGRFRVATLALTGDLFRVPFLLFLHFWGGWGGGGGGRGGGAGGRTV